MGNMHKPRISLFIVLSLCNLALVVSCGDTAMLRRLADERASVGAAPSTIDEIKAEIAKFEKEADRVVEAAMKSGVYWRMLALKYQDHKMYTESLDAARKALEYYPANSNILWIIGVDASFLAKAQVASGNDGIPLRDEYFRIAEESFKAALGYDDRYVRALYGLAILYAFELDRPEEAEPYLVRILSIDTENIDAMFVLGRVLYVTEQFEEAARIFERIASITKIEEKKKQAEENRKQALDALYGTN